jgi:hypothetical protein
LRLTRKFYQQKGQFCIDVTWRSGNKSTVYLNVFKSSSKVLFSKNYELSGYNDTHRFLTNFEKAGIRTVELETSRNTFDNEIVIIKNCSNTCNAVLIIKYALNYFRTSHQMGTFDWHLGNWDPSSLAANYYLKKHQSKDISWQTAAYSPRVRFQCNINFI